MLILLYLVRMGFVGYDEVSWLQFSFYWIMKRDRWETDIGQQVLIQGCSVKGISKVDFMLAISDMLGTLQRIVLAWTETKMKVSTVTLLLNLVGRWWNCGIEGNLELTDLKKALVAFLLNLCLGSIHIKFFTKSKSISFL